MGSTAADGSFVNALIPEGGDITLIAAGFNAGDLIVMNIDGIRYTSVIAGADGTVIATVAAELYTKAKGTFAISAGAHQGSITDTSGAAQYKAPFWIVAK